MMAASAGWPGIAPMKPLATKPGRGACLLSQTAKNGVSRSQSSSGLSWGELRREHKRRHARKESRSA